MLTGPQQQWVDALRSGKYKQTDGVLRKGDGFCCLGVGCDLAVKAGIIDEAKQSFGTEYDYDGEVSKLPDKVREWLGLSTAEGLYNGFGSSSLVRHNDVDEMTFPEIAAVIESKPEWLFIS